MRHALDKEARYMAEKRHPRLKREISAAGGNTFGYNIDPRLQAWGRAVIEIQRCQGMLAKQKPDVFLTPEEEKANLAELAKIIEALKKMKKDDQKIMKTESGWLKVTDNSGTLAFYEAKEKNDLNMNKADRHFYVAFDKKGEPEALMWMDLQQQRQENNGRSSHYMEAYTVGVPLCLLTLKKNREFRDMLEQSVGIYSQAVARKKSAT